MSWRYSSSRGLVFFFLIANNKQGYRYFQFMHSSWRNGHIGHKCTHVSHQYKVNLCQLRSKTLSTCLRHAYGWPKLNPCWSPSNTTPLFYGDQFFSFAKKGRHVICYWKAFKDGFFKKMPQASLLWQLKKFDHQGCHKDDNWIFSITIWHNPPPPLLIGWQLKFFGHQRWP